MPITDKAKATILEGRNECSEAIKGNDKRLLIVVGPCSIHDEKGAIEYAEKLAELRKIISSTMIIVMRVYFEKPRTTTG